MSVRACCGCVAFAVALVTTSQTFAQTKAAAVPRGPDLRCGSYALYVALKGLEHPAGTFAELEEKLGQPSAEGYSMGQLAEAAEVLGAKTLGVETNLRNLQRRDGRFACIALLDQAHFVNLVSIGDREALVIDAPNEYRLPLDTFRSRWTGKVLLVSREPLAPEEEIGTGLVARWEDATAGWSAGRAMLVVAAISALVATPLPVRRLRRGG